MQQLKLEKDLVTLLDITAQGSVGMKGAPGKKLQTKFKRA